MFGACVGETFSEGSLVEVGGAVLGEAEAVDCVDALRGGANVGALSFEEGKVAIRGSVGGDGDLCWRGDDGGIGALSFEESGVGGGGAAAGDGVGG